MKPPTVDVFFQGITFSIYKTIAERLRVQPQQIITDTSLIRELTTQHATHHLLIATMILNIDN